MDKTKKITKAAIFVLLTLILTATLSPLQANTVEKIQFGGVEYSYSSDSINLKFNLLDNTGQHIKNVPMKNLYESLQIFESGHQIQNGEFLINKSGVLIPKENTISVLIDRGINPKDKSKIFESIRNLVESSADSSIYISFLDDKVTETFLLNTNNFNNFRNELMKDGERKYFYSALFSKLLEFDVTKSEDYPEYQFNRNIARRAVANPENNSMFIFVDGNEMADISDPIQYIDVTKGVSDLSIKPKIYAFYYLSGSSFDQDVELTLSGITGSSTSMDFPKGKYVSAGDEEIILMEVGKAIDEQKYDYSFVYNVKDKVFTGIIPFEAKWDNRNIGNAVFSIGSPENPWPQSKGDAGDYLLQFLLAILVTLLTILFFVLVIKGIVPFIKSKTFSAKYYNRYIPEEGVHKRLCSYCKQPIEPGELVVNKCKHIMHVKCWKDNDYRCAEYGQNCNIGIQEHVDWGKLFRKETILETRQTISGILAGFISWIVYELIGRGIFPGLASCITDFFVTDESKRLTLLNACTSKVESFLAIGIILGFFLSLIFRLNDEYRKKNFRICLKIFGFSLLTSLIGFFAFSFGGVILCMLVSLLSSPGIPWYCSMPAYLLFSICVSLSLTIKTSIPVKSAMLGGICSAVIGFIVLYCTNNSNHPWITMLLNFVIYGGGLGASLVTVRMLSEKYFLVIQNGPRKGVRIPIHKWMNAIGGNNKVLIGMTGDCEIQMNWDKSNKVAKEHVMLYIDKAKSLPILKPQAANVILNSRIELPVRHSTPLNNGDTFKIGDTIFLYEETD